MASRHPQPGDVAGLGAREADRGAPQHTVEIRRCEVVGAVIRGIGIGDILGARRRWRSWCRCIRMRSIDKIGISEIGIAPTPLLGRLCGDYG